MANTITRLTTGGNYYIAGQFDEVTYSKTNLRITNLLSYSSNVNTYSTPGWSYTVASSNNSVATINTAPTTTTTDPFGGYNAVSMFTANTTFNEYWEIYQGYQSWPGFTTTGITNGYTATLSIYVKAAGYNNFGLQFYEQNGTNSVGATFTNLNTATPTATAQKTGVVCGIINAGNGWWRCWFTRTCIGTAFTQAYFYPINNSGSATFIGDGTPTTYIFGPQLEINTSPTAGPSNYIPTGALGVPLSNSATKLYTTGDYYVGGQLDEVTFNPNQSAYRKNLLNNSATPTNAAGGTYPWTGTFANTAVFQVANTADPVGTFTAYKFVEGYSPVGQYVFWQQNFPGQYGVTYTFSMYVKPAEYNYMVFTIYDDHSYSAYFNLITGATTSVSAGATAGSSYVGNGWWRVWITRTFVNTLKLGQVFFNFAPTVNTQFYAGDGVSGGFFWGPQLEQSSYPTIYEPTGLNAIPSSNSVMKTDNTGNNYITGQYDEFTKGMNIVTNGLIYYFDPAKPDSYNGGNTIYDLTKTNPPGSLVGGYSYNYNNGGVITLDGSSGYANTGILANTSQFQSTSAFTMSAWVKFNGRNFSSGGTATILGSFNLQGFGIGYTCDSLGQLQSIYGEMRTNNFIVSSGGLSYPPYNTWYNFVWVYSSSNLANTNVFYVNGTQYGPNQAATNTAYNTAMVGQYITVGSNNPVAGTNAGSFNGQIGQCLIYNRALSNTEILQNFSDMRSQYGV